MQAEDWRGKAFSGFSHTACEAFPCHDIDRGESFNCLFCYCPLYALDDKCGGRFFYRGDGVKDCSGCAFPHIGANYGLVLERLKDLAERMRQRREEP